MSVPGPCSSRQNEGYEKRGHDVTLPQGEDTNHENLKDDDPPNQPYKGQRPSLTSRFVGLVKYCKGDVTLSNDADRNGIP